MREEVTKVKCKHIQGLRWDFPGMLIFLSFPTVFQNAYRGPHYPHT
jgi:hypothetical protein